ncbi:MAG: membrane protein insertase YidC [Verrucomicrobia bacterium]|nr:membrane protein insertase YidC [Verrucomicrobiota bacterium]
MDKKSLPIIIACLLLLFGWQWFADKMWPPPPPGAKKPAVAGQQTNVVAAPVAPAPVPAVVAAPAAPAVPAEPPKPRPAEQTAALENDFIRAGLTSYGGGIRDVVLKKWGVTAAAKERVRLNQFGADPILSLTGGPVTGTNNLAALAAWPGADTNAAYTLRDSAKDRAVFACDAPGGLRIVKEFVLGADYTLKCKLRLENAGAQPLAVPAWGLSLGTVGQLDENDDATFVNADYWDGAAVSMTGRANASYHVASSLAGKPLTATGPVKWATVKNRYFATVLNVMLPAKETNATHLATGFHAEEMDLPKTLTPKSSTPPQGARAAMLFDALTLQPGATAEREFTLYTGPKEFHRLQALGDKQEEVMEFGMWGRISQLLLWSLNGLYQMIPSYGIAIIILTLIIKLIFWPIQAMSTRSMKKMQALKPLMDKLKEKFPDDPQKQQQEMMKLYKVHKVNPMGGCLPLVVQIPVFFALYTMLRAAIELRGASFLWIKDLSMPDTVFDLGSIPLNPLPLLMTATTIWQQKLTPVANVDPTQQKMMMLMPLMFLFMFYSMSSGLVLYWTVQNLLSILQQWLALREHKPAPAAAPAKR